MCRGLKTLLGHRCRDQNLAAGDDAAAVAAFRQVLETIPRDSAADPASLEALERRAQRELADLGLS